MCDSDGNLVASISVKSEGEAQELQVRGSVSRARHEDGTKVERCRRDVWSAVGREVGVDADRAVSDSVTPGPGLHWPMRDVYDVARCISVMYCACKWRDARVVM